MFKRFRRVRLNSKLRDLITETKLTTDDFIYPLFIKEGAGFKKEIGSMPGVFQMSIDEILKECETLKTLGLYSIILFGIPETKDSVGSDALCEHGIIAKSIKAIKEAHPDMFVTSDLCFCEYTDHGHCGILDIENETVNNDATLEILGEQAVHHAKAGVD
ncbi:MAG TPA: porphobilinogen synthase, partial [Campylobacterales bacterium]|nr:porphobilinogen synthase [Campylobacterales bacterium]